MKSIRRYLPEIDLETEKIPSEVLQSMQIKLIDFYDAMHEVVPTAMREFYRKTKSLVARCRRFRRDQRCINR